MDNDWINEEFDVHILSRTLVVGKTELIGGTQQIVLFQALRVVMRNYKTITELEKTL